jgi:hypothetical protein
MRKVGLFLLALVLVGGFFGCGGDDDDDSITIGIIGDPKCIDGVATGTITNVNTGWVSETITVSPGATTIVALPEEGIYRFRFEDKNGSWDFTGEMHDMGGLNLNCSG